MFDFLFSSEVGESLTFGHTLIVVGCSILLGLFISLVYILTHKQEGYSTSFSVTLIMLPSIIAIIILLVGNNVARAFSLAGAFSLIRFRSAPGDPKDIAYVFFTLAVGLACGMGYIGYATLFAVVLCLVMFVLSFVKYGTSKSSMMTLRIVIPENLNYQGLFDDILKQYTSTSTLKRIKTSDFGALFEISYRIVLKDEMASKDLIDAIRARNGNLQVSLTLRETEEKVM